MGMVAILGQKKQQSIRFSGTAAFVQKVLHIWFFFSGKFFPTHKNYDTGFYSLIWESFLTKLQSRPQTYVILTYLKRKSVNYDLFMLFETLNLHFRYFK